MPPNVKRPPSDQPKRNTLCYVDRLEMMVKEGKMTQKELESIPAYKKSLRKYILKK